MFYFDCTGIYGKGNHEKPEFETLNDFIAELDRLGIWAALTVNIAARDSHAYSGNKQLMDDIAAIPGAEDRIVPAFVVSPKNYYEKVTMNYLLEMLESGRLGAIAIYPKTCRYPIIHLERLFEKIADYSPLVLVDCGELNGQSDCDGLVKLANQFPQMNFVFRNAMWGDAGCGLDLMWRCKNMYMDMSRLHVQGSYELIKNYAGEGRCLFGKGYRALGGAAQAALKYSGLVPEEEAQVAGLRLLSLLPNKAEVQRLQAAIREIDFRAPNTLWKELMSGNGVSSAEIIDVHTHIDDANGNGWMGETVGFDEMLEVMMKTQDKLGINSCIGSSGLGGDSFEGNRYLQSKVAHLSSRIKGYYGYNPIYGDKITEAELDERFADGFFVGFKTLADYWHIPVTDPSYEPMLRYADKHRCVILYHSWEGSYDTPDMIAEVAAKYPNATFLIAHSGGEDVGRRQAERACLALPNVYLEFCGSFCAKRTIRATLDVIGADRFVFGTDTQGHDQAWELGRLLSENITDDELKQILSENIKKILARRTF